MHKTNLHTHSFYCDGKNSPEEMVLAAIKNNFNSLGISS
ncbi:MAG: histidinol phosphate phosphatase, partial [Tissierellia bacterium]|nr:histidinol phosphate phosphatase [Tissierellia bacterium]